MCEWIDIYVVMCVFDESMGGWESAKRRTPCYFIVLFRVCVHLDTYMTCVDNYVVTLLLIHQWVGRYVI